MLRTFFIGVTVRVIKITLAQNFEKKLNSSQEIEKYTQTKTRPKISQNGSNRRGPAVQTFLKELIIRIIPRTLVKYLM